MKKILVGAILIMFTCLLTLGCVGCDARNGAKLYIYGMGSVTVERPNYDNYSKASDYYAVVEARRVSALSFIREISYEPAQGSNMEGKVWQAGNNEDGEYLTAYQHFIHDGGMVTGFNISQPAGTYTMTLTYDNASLEIEYRITDSVLTD